MAEILSRLKAFDAPQRDIIVSTKPIEVDSNDSDDLDDQIIKTATELVALYQIQAKTTEGLINRDRDLKSKYDVLNKDYDTAVKSRDALAKELKETTERLTKRIVELEKELEKARKELEKEKAAHKVTKVELEKKLKNEEISHAKTKADLVKSENRREDEKAAHQETRDKLKLAEEKLHKKESELTQVKNDLLKARVNYNNAAARADENRRQLDEANRNESAANERAMEANKRADRLKKETHVLQREIDSLKKELEHCHATSSRPIFVPKPGHTFENVYIDVIMYGGKIFTDKATIDTFLQLLKNRTVFEVHNRLFPEDPWYLNLKTLTVVYSVDGKPFQYLHEKEWEKVSFVH